MHHSSCGIASGASLEKTDDSDQSGWRRSIMPAVHPSSPFQRCSGGGGGEGSVSYPPSSPHPQLSSFHRPSAVRLLPILSCPAPATVQLSSSCPLSYPAPAPSAVQLLLPDAGDCSIAILNTRFPSQQTNPPSRLLRLVLSAHLSLPATTMRCK